MSRFSRTRAARVGLGAVAMAVAVAALAAFVAPAHAQLVPRGSAWKYFAGPASPGPGAGWEQPGFADGSWPSGPGPLGYSESYIVTTIPYGGNPNSVWMTYYFRTTFFLADDPDTMTALKLGLNYDDGVIVYLNGVEIARRNMPAGPVTWSTQATLSREANNTYEQVDVGSAIPLLVQNATNTVAVEVHQASPQSFDLPDLRIQFHTIPGRFALRNIAARWPGGRAAK